MDQPGTVASPARSAEQGKSLFLCPRSRLRIWFCETELAIPSRVSLLIPRIQVVAYTNGIVPAFRDDGVHIYTVNRHWVCMCVVNLFILDVRPCGRIPAGVTQEEGHTGFLIHLPSAVLALIWREGFSRSFPSSTVKSNFVY